jgi:hypothetical protein
MFKDILKSATRFSGNHLHFEWVHDLNISQISKLDLLANTLDFNWSTHMAISQVLRNNFGPNRSELVHLFKHLQSTSRLTSLWTWDLEFHGRKYGKFRIQKVPDIQNTELRVMRCDLCSVVEIGGLPIKMIGLVGQLYGYRGVDLVASFARTYKNHNFLLIGREHSWSYSKSTKRFIKRNPANLMIKSEYLDTDFDLNHAINHLSCLVIDTGRYPEPSGIATRALAFGIPVLIKDYDSYLRFQSKAVKGIHIIRKSFKKNLVVDWVKIGQPITSIVQSKDLQYLELLDAKRATENERS